MFELLPQPASTVDVATIGAAETITVGGNLTETVGSSRVVIKGKKILQN